MSRQIILCLVVFVLFVDVVSAQGNRRSVGRPPVPTPTPRPGPPIGPREPLYQGDGRLMERVFNLVNVATRNNAQLKPVAVFYLADFDECKRTAQVVAEKVRLSKGSTEKPVFLNALLATFEWFAANGFDTKQPLGYALLTDGMTFYPLAFVPLDWESQVGQSVLNRIAQRRSDGQYVLRQEVYRWPTGDTLYVRQHGNWTFITMEPLLNALPDDPTELLRGVDRKSLLAVRYDLYNMPRLATNAMFYHNEEGMIARTKTELEKAAIRLGIAHLRSLSDQNDFLELTLAYDEQKNDFVFTQRETVRPNTERHQLFRQRCDTISPFHGFYHPDRAILASHVVQPLTQLQRENLEIILDETVGKSLLTEKERQQLKQVAELPTPLRRNRPNGLPTNAPGPANASARLAELLAIEAPETSEEPNENLTDAQKVENIVRRIVVSYYVALLGSVRSGDFDGAITLSMRDGFMGAYRIVDGEAFRKAFDDLMAALVEKYPTIYAERIRKDYATAQGFSLTDIVLRLDDLFPNAWWMQYVPDGVRQQPSVRAVFGVRNDTLCFAVGLGEMPEQRLRKAVAGTERPQRVDDLFYTFSAYELGQAIADSDRPGPLSEIRMALANGDSTAKVYAVSKFTDTSKTQTLRISGLLTPSLWKMREWVLPRK